MAIDVTQAPNFLVDTDFFVDNIIYLTNGSFAAAASTSGIIKTIPHGLPFTPLVGGTWALTSDFSVSYEYSTGTFPSTVAGQFYNTASYIYADATNVYIATDNVVATPQTIFYRVFGFQPTTSNADIPPISSGDSFFFSSDYNNPKLFNASSAALPDTNGSGVPFTVNLIHGFGYIPQAMGWIDSGTYTFPVNSGSSISSLPSAHSTTLMNVDTNAVHFLIPAFQNAQTGHIRVYVDQ